MRFTMPVLSRHQGQMAAKDTGQGRLSFVNFPFSRLQGNLHLGQHSPRLSSGSVLVRHGLQDKTTNGLGWSCITFLKNN